MEAQVVDVGLGPTVQIHIDEYFAERDHWPDGWEVDAIKAIESFAKEFGISQVNVRNIFSLGVMMYKVHGKLPMDAGMIDFARRKTV